MSTDTIRIRITVSIGLVGCKVTRIMKFDRDDWTNMTEDEQREAVKEEIDNHNMVEWGYEEMDGE